MRLRMFILTMVAMASILATGPAAQAAQWFHYGYAPASCPIAWVTMSDGYWEYQDQAAVYFTPDGYESGWYQLDSVDVWINQDGGIPGSPHVQGFELRIYRAGSGGISNPAPGDLVYFNYYDVGTALDSACPSGCIDGHWINLDLSASGTPPVFAPGQDFIAAILPSVSEPMVGMCPDGFNGEPPAAYRNRIRDVSAGYAWGFTDGHGDGFDGDFIMVVNTSVAPPEVPATGPVGLALLLAGLGFALRRNARKRA